MAGEFVDVQIEQGILRGQRIALAEGGSFVSFKGVPYAKPPLGPLRFKDAQPPEPWQGVRDALIEGANCTQFNMDGNVYLGHEDCLYLNVYTPCLPSPGVDPLPVMVWIHGGGFSSGSGSTEHYGPDHLMGENIVLVTINYRLGPLGFLYLGKAAPGNAGLKDQVAALRWVQKNITNFGGDAKNVTIFGESAGGASVHFHMLSPLSKGLFHRAIAQSGAAINPWARQKDPAETTRRLARALGCCSEDPCAIVDFLRGVDHTELVRAATEKALPERERDRLLKFPFATTPEYPVDGVEMFLPASVDELMASTHHQVPYMTGVTTHESLIIVAFVDYRDEVVAREVDAKWETNVLSELRLPLNGSHGKAVIEDIRRFYMDGRPLSKETRAGFQDMLTDLTFSEGIFQVVKCIANSGKSPVYLYEFSADDELNYIKKLWNINEPGACHADENGYLFSSTRLNTHLPADSSAVAVRRRLLRLWANFARTGNPTPTDDPLLGVRWKPYTEQERNYLQIGPELRTGTNLYAERRAFWEKLYQKYAS